MMDLKYYSIRKRSECYMNCLGGGGREMKVGVNYTINSGFLYRQTGQLCFQIPPFPLTWGAFFSLFVQTQHFFLSFFFCLI